MEIVVNKFLESKNLRRPILLALSGGPDSLALLNVLHSLREKLSLQIGIAHVDHGWRLESREESQILQKQCESLNLPFYLRTLDPSLLVGNLEAASRQERLHFFRELCQAYDYQAVILGHHSDDHAETVFKRIMEGTTLPHLHGLREETEVDGVILWRPLLQITKKEIEAYISLHNLKPFRDSTNLDPQYLRTRLRGLLPELSQKFGKDVRSTLNRLSLESVELHDYLSEKLSHVQIHSGPMGSYLDLSDAKHPFEIRFLIRKLCERENVFFSYSLVEQAAQHIINKQADCWVMMGVKRMYVDRGRVFVLRNIHLEMPERQSVSASFGPWEIRFGEQGKGWQSVWPGVIYIPEFCKNGGYEIGLPDNSISKRWGNAKIPSFLKSVIPVIWKGADIVCWAFK